MACVTKSEQGRRFREFESLEWPVILPVWAVVGVVLSREVCSAQGASGPSAKAATARRMLVQTRSARVPSPAIL